MEELYVWIIFIFKCEKELTWEKELKMRSLKEAISKNGVVGYVKAFSLISPRIKKQKTKLQWW